MLSIGLILQPIPLFSYRITLIIIFRITSIVPIYFALLSFNGLYVESLASGVGIYSGIIPITIMSRIKNSIRYIISFYNSHKLFFQYRIIVNKIRMGNKNTFVSRAKLFRICFVLLFTILFGMYFTENIEMYSKN